MIKLLSLKNFKSIKENDFEISNLTLFSGLNGMGKSSALQSLLLLRQSYEKHMLPNIGLSLSGDYVQLGNGKDVLFSNAVDEKIKIEVWWDEINLNLAFDYKENSDMQPLLKGESEIKNDAFNESLFISQFQYLSAERISPKSVYNVSEFAVNERRSLGKKGEYTAHFLSQHGDKVIHIKALQHKSSTTELLNDNLNAWMSDITPGTKVITKLIPEINQASLHYQFSSSKELTEQFRPENTGFGLTYVLPVVTAVLSSQPGDLLIIENPESHLHPSGQSIIAKLISLAAQNGVQIIVETHSDHFLNGIRTSVKKKYIDAENVIIYYLSRNKENSEHCADVEKVEIDTQGRISTWPSGFFDEWDKSLTTLLEEN